MLGELNIDDEKELKSHFDDMMNKLSAIDHESLGEIAQCTYSD